MNKFVVVFVFLFFLISCGGSNSASKLIPTSAVIENQTSNATIIEGDLVSLSASRSTGAASLSYQWQLTAKPDASTLTLNNASGESLAFQVDIAGSYEISLTVTDGSHSATTQYTLSVVANSQPEIRVERSSGHDSLVVGENLRLDASQSSDPEARELAYQWELLTQPEASNLSPSTDDYFDFTPVIRGDYEIQLSVFDGFNTSTQLFEYKAIESRASLIADANSSLPAVEQVGAVFGTDSTDLPETHDDEHLMIETDTQIGDHFAFIVHLEKDGDRDTPLEQTDRQRSEIKTYSNSADSLTCEQGESMSLFWQFKAEDIGLSYSFSHLFQIKGSNDHPLLTFTARRISSEDNALRVLHGEQDTVLAEVDWKLIKERWLNATLHFSCKDKGYLTVQISDVETQNQLISLHIPEIDMWQDIELDKLGFKFGLYRRVKLNADDEHFREGLDSLEDKVRVGSIRTETH